MASVHLYGHTDTLQSHKMMILQMRDGSAGGFEKAAAPSPIFTLSSSWYTRHRTLVSIGLLLMLFLTLFVQNSLADGPILNLNNTFNFLSTFSTLNTSNSSNVSILPHVLPPPVLPLTASERLVRVNSADRYQYINDFQWHVWSYTSCSGISMEEVMNAYGSHLIAADVLQVELNLGVWGVYSGLLREEGITMTAAHFGFKTDASHSRTLNDLISVSNKGFPIIVGVRDGYYFPGGHLFVVHGGDSQYVYIADSSLANFTRMTHAMFLSMWQGFSAILKPQ
jgi:hypothetical protein